MNFDEKSYKWLSDWADFGEELILEWHVSVLQQRRLLTGKSGAKVILVDIVMPDYNGLAILKFAVDNNEPGKNEFDRHSVAENLDPDFAAKHLPKTVKSFRKDNRIAYLMTVAGEGLNYTTSFFELPATRQYCAAQKVSSVLLTEWNRNSCLEKTGADSTEVFEAWLSHRIGKNSYLPDLIADLIGLNEL